MDSELCEGCIPGKVHRLPFGTKEKAAEPGQRIYRNVCGPVEESMSGFRYFVSFKDGWTKFRTIYFIKEKSEVAKRLDQFIAETKTTGYEDM